MWKNSVQGELPEQSSREREVCRGRSLEICRGPPLGILLDTYQHTQGEETNWGQGKNHSTPLKRIRGSWNGQHAPVLVCSGGHDKIPQTEWRKQQKLVSHNSGGWKVQDQGAIKFLYLRGGSDFQVEYGAAWRKWCERDMMIGELQRNSSYMEDHLWINQTWSFDPAETSSLGGSKWNVPAWAKLREDDLLCIQRT